MKKTLAAILIIMTLATCACAYNSNTQLGDGLLYDEKFENGVQTHYFTYTAGKSVSPVLVCGSKQYGRSTVDKLIAGMNGVIGAVNADFFTLATGITEGLVVTNGIMRSSDSYQNAVGVNADGTLFIGTPQLLMKLTRTDGLEISVTYFNKVRTKYGTYLLDNDFSAETRVAGSGTDVLLKVNSGSVKLGESVSLTVENITKTSESTVIPEGYMVLTVSDDAPANNVGKLAVGDTLTFTATTQDTRFYNAVYAFGAGAYLVKNGKAEAKLSERDKAVTALGIKPNGEAVFFTADNCDGSQGMSLSDTAQKLISMGCVTAVNLDGGGSTTAAAVLPGFDALAVKNTPEDGEIRACANYLVFVNNAVRTGIMTKLYLYPSHEYALAGGKVTFTAAGTDDGYYSVTPQNVTYSIPENPVTVTSDTTVTASADGLSVSATVKVINSVDRIYFYNEDTGKRITSLKMKPLETVHLKAIAYYDNREVASDDVSFTWASGKQGIVDPDGTLHATPALRKTGSVTVSFGKVNAVLPVTVTTDYAPFTVERYAE